jgi:pimeloyl-ACP methyl ester carboxylesterase
MLLDGLKQDPDQALQALQGFALSDSAGEALKAKIAEQFKKVSPDLVHGDLSACNEFDVMERLSSISLPTCIIAGEEDKLTPIKYAVFLKEKIPNSEMVAIRDAGHLAMAEKPEEFNSCLIDFVNRLKADRLR